MAQNLEKEYVKVVRRIAKVAEQIKAETKKYGEPRDKTVLRGDSLLSVKDEILSSMAEAEAEKDSKAKKKKVARTPEKVSKLRSLSQRGRAGGGSMMTPDDVVRRGRRSLFKQE